MSLPMRNTDTVRVAPLPGVRVPTGIPEDAFGTSSTLDLGGLQKSIAQISERETQKANDTALLDADNQLARLSADLHAKAQRFKGKDALGAHDTIGADWQKGAADIAKNLRLNDQQQRLFNERVGMRGDQLYSAVTQHAERESQAYQEQTFESGLQNRANDAVEHYTDPSVVATSLSETKSLIARWGQHQGWAPETVASTTAKYVSQVHTGIIDRMLANGNDQQAIAYYRSAQRDVLGSEQGTVEKALKLGSTRGTSQRVADELMASSVDQTGALQEIAKRAQDPNNPLSDPNVREWTEDRVRRLWQDKAQGIRLKHEMAYDQAAQILTRTKDFSQIPPKVLLDLSPTEINNLRREEHYLRHPEKVTDEDLYYSLLNEAGLNDGTRTQFMNRRLSDVRDRLSDADFHSLANLQLRIRAESGRGLAGEAKAEAKKAEKSAAHQAIVDEVKKYMKPGGETPKVPGAPIQRAQPATLAPQSTPPDTGGRRSTVPRAWIEHAKRDPNYRRYLEHLGVVIQ